MSDEVCHPVCRLWRTRVTARKPVSNQNHSKEMILVGQTLVFQSGDCQGMVQTISRALKSITVLAYVTIYPDH